MVNLADHLLMYAPLKFKAVLLRKCFVTYRQVLLTFIASKSLKFSVTSKSVY